MLDDMIGSAMEISMRGRLSVKGGGGNFKKRAREADIG